MKKEKAVEVSSLTKCFGELVAVDHVKFEVEKGEFFGFLGPNGAGKTTTIRILTGVIKPDEGNVQVLGYDVLENSIEAKQLMGVVPEMANAYLDLSAWNNLMLVGALYGVPKELRKERASKLLKEFKLYERRNCLVKGFSKGMKQKLLLCMALINEPEILFLDEPTSGLDVESRRLIIEVIQKLNKEGKTVFLTTHNIEEANQLCDRVAIINRGRIAAVDRPEKLRLKSSGLQSIEVSFDRKVDVEEVLEIEGVNKARKMGDKIKIYIDDPDAAINELVDFARSKKLKIVSLNTLAPSLEDVFLKLIKEN